MPGVRAARTYDPHWLARDLVAGTVLCALLIPQGMAYAELAGLPAITGLYTTIVCLVAYAVFGPSPYLVLGPDSSLGPMIAAAVLPLAAGDLDAAVALAGMLALMVGGISVAARVARLGFVADLLSLPVRVGYLAGLAATIFVGQLPRLFGFSIDSGNLLAGAAAFLDGLDQTNPWALASGLLCLVVIVATYRIAPHRPGVLYGVLAAMVASVLLDLAAKDVVVVGVLPQGFPLPTLPIVSGPDLIPLAAAALGITLVAIGDTISTSAGFAARRGHEVDSDQEIMGIGAANLLAGLFQGFPVSTSSSRTAVAEQSGAKTQLTGLVAAALILLMLVFLPGLVRYLPQPALAAVVIVASISLIDVAALRRIWSVRKSEFVLALACALGVALVGVLEGIAIAVVLSILHFFERAWRPYAAVLGKPEGVAGYHDVTRYPGAEQIPGLVMIRWDAPLFFANASLFRDRIRTEVARAVPPPEWIVVAAEPVTDIDTTASDMLVGLDVELNGAGIHLIFAELKDPVRDKIERYGLYATIDRHHFYPTIEEAVDAFYQETGRPRQAPSD